MFPKRTADAESSFAAHATRVVAFPSRIAPMLTSAGPHGFPETGWIYEPKLDGICCMDFTEDGKLQAPFFLRFRDDLTADGVVRS